MITALRPFDGITNFRDFGGYRSRSGGCVARRLLFRSGHSAAASTADLESLAQLDIGLIVDLRRRTERGGAPSPPVPRFTGQRIDTDLGDLAEGPHLVFLRSGDLSAGSIDRFLHDYYSTAPFDPRHRELFARYFNALASLDKAVWIHCTAGKDRTGILAALTHELLGVHSDDVSEDFMLTNTATRLEERMATSAPALEAMIGRKPTEAALRCFLGVRAENLHAALAAIRSRTGSVEEYTVNFLNVPREKVTALRERLIEGR
jgi:protein tyrosine/serine phosphatase